MRLEFEGDWDPREATAIANQLKKSMGMSDSGLDELTPEQITLPKLLSPRQRKLIEMIRTAGKKALEECGEGEECELPPDWEEYALSKGALSTGQVKVSPKGKFRLNQNRRWERIDDDQNSSSIQVGSNGLDVGSFELPPTTGDFGWGVYLPVLAEPSGGLRLRLRLDLSPDAMISDEEFYDLESDFTENVGLMLDSKGVKAIARTEDETVTLLMVRDSSDIKPLGIVAGSGTVPGGKLRFNLVNLETREDHLVADVEMVEDGESLQKSAATAKRSTLQSASYLNGTKLLATSAPELDRVLVRQAVEACKRDMDFGSVRVQLAAGVPDFLSSANAFCLPSDQVVWLCPHDPQAAIATFTSELAVRLQSAVRAGAMPGDVALNVLAVAAKLTPQRWLELLIKRYAGASLVEAKFNILAGGEPPARYMNLLVGRGLAHWGNRRAIVECMAEDFRCAHDFGGLPNLITLEWDLAVPALARLGQQVLTNYLKD